MFANTNSYTKTKKRKKIITRENNSHKAQKYATLIL